MDCFGCNENAFEDSDDDEEEVEEKGDNEEEDDSSSSVLLFPNLTELKLHNVGIDAGLQNGSENLVNLLKLNKVKLKILDLEDARAVKGDGIESIKMTEKVVITAAAFHLLADCITACNSTIQDVRLSIDKETSFQVTCMRTEFDCREEFEEWNDNIYDGAFNKLVGALEENDTIENIKIVNSNDYGADWVLHGITRQSKKRMIKMLESNTSIQNMTFRILDERHAYGMVDFQLERYVRQYTQRNRDNRGLEAEQQQLQQKPRARPSRPAEDHKDEPDRKKRKSCD